MPKYEFLISVRNSPNPLGVREGDIVGVLMNTGGKIGRKEMDGWLIVPIKVPNGLSVQDLWEKFKVPLYEGGLFEWVDFRDIDFEEDAVEPIYPNNLYSWHINTSMIIPKPAMLSKYRYKIDFGRFATSNLNFSKVRNEKIIYQPFLKKSRIINMSYLTSSKGHYFVRVKNGKHKLVKTYQDKNSKSDVVPIGVEYEIYTDTPSIGNEIEKVFKWKEGVNLIQDKYDNSWVYPDGNK